MGIDRIPPIVDHYLMGIRIGGRAKLTNQEVLKMGYGYDYPAAIIITDTSAHTGRFGKVHALKDSEATFVLKTLQKMDLQQ